MSASRRPRTIHEVSRRVAGKEQDFHPALREFLDVFYTCRDERATSIAECPVSLGSFEDAYLGATAEHLARLYLLEVPEWSETYGLGLRGPYFAGGLESLKAILFVESPTAFRRRMLFVSKNALDRARGHAGTRAMEREEDAAARLFDDGLSEVNDRDDTYRP